MKRKSSKVFFTKAGVSSFNKNVSEIKEGELVKKKTNKFSVVVQVYYAKSPKAINEY